MTCKDSFTEAKFIGKEVKGVAKREGNFVILFTDDSFISINANSSELEYFVLEEE